MKKILLVLFALVSCVVLQSQTKPWYVIQVNGKATYQNRELQVGDSLFESSFKEVKFSDKTSVATLCHPENGVIRYDFEARERLISSKDEVSFREMLLYLLGIKSDYKELKSRGDCECQNPVDCLLPDPAISEWTILSESIVFSNSRFGKGTYFVQFEHQGETINRVLSEYDENVYLNKGDFLLKDSTYYDFKNPAQLGFISDSDQQAGASPEFICSLKLRILDEQEIKNHISLIEQAMSPWDQDSLKEEIMYSLYISFGKPRRCDVENWLK